MGGIMGLDGVRALGFDVFGTVVDWRGGIARDAGPFLKRHSGRDDPLAFADAWRGQYQPAMEKVRSGQRPFSRLPVDPGEPGVGQVASVDASVDEG